MTQREGMVAVFSGGGLRDPQTQLDLLGRLVPGADDALPGYTVDYVDIRHPHIVAATGETTHRIVRRTGDLRDKAIGQILWVDERELDAVDDALSPGFYRIEVTLASGASAWTYIAAPDPDTGGS